jgi:lipoprotein NlpD
MNQDKSRISLLLCVAALGTLGACTSTLRQAPVIDRAPPVAEAAHPAEAPKEDAHGMYTVKKGDTLLRIALDHGQSYRDLVAWNNLANPNDIKVDQVLRVLPPEHAVQTAAVATPPELRPAAPVLPKKTTPRGDKRPFSEANLAELQKADAKPAEAGPAAAPAVPAATPSVASAVPASLPTALAVPAPLAVPAVAEEEKLSWMWPSEGKVVATFDEGKNKGIDIAGKAGQLVMAAGAGKVMYAGSGIRGYGNLVIVKHNNSMLSAYAHNRTIVVKEGQTVAKGQPIAEMGDSDADSVKLHFEIRQQGKPVDPSKFLPTR